MREIKFRAWEKTLKEIIPVHDIDFEMRMINTESAWRTFNDIELKQYTGLKDSKGKEIYEGDIVKLHDKLLPFTVGNRTGVVVFENGSFVIKNDYSTNYRWIDYDYLEVFGNVFENPSLVEG